MSKIKCGIGDCQFSHELARVVGAHRFRIHKVQGMGNSAKTRRKLKVLMERAERTLTVPEREKIKVRLECPYCPKDFASDNGRRYHLQRHHQEEQRLEQPIRSIEPLKRGRVSQNGHAPLPQNVTLTEAIHVLQAEVDAHLQVIARLKQLQGRQ